jgi:hypothetical protein
MNPLNELPQSFRDQRLKFLFLLEDETKKVLVSGVIEPLPNDVLSFAQALIACRTEEAAQSHIRTNPATARAFHAMSQSLAYAVGKGDVQLSIPTVPGQTPFYALGFCVGVWVQNRSDTIGNRWNRSH